MTRVEKTLTDVEWLEIIEVARVDPQVEWRFDGDDDYFLEGRLEACPTGEPSGWRERALLMGLPP